MEFRWDIREVKILVSAALVMFPSAITAEVYYPTPGHVIGFTMVIAIGGFLMFLLTIVQQGTDRIQLIFEKTQ